MTTHVIMNVARPNGAGGIYKAGVEYDLPDDLAALWRGQGVCRLTSVRSEQTGAVVSATSGNFPDAPAQNKRFPVEYTANLDGIVGLGKVGIVNPVAPSSGVAAQATRTGGIFQFEYPESDVDVLIYGASPAGIMAACRAASEGVSVAIVEPSAYFGGMDAGGLSYTDYRSYQYSNMNSLTAAHYRKVGALAGLGNWDAVYGDGNTSARWNLPCQFHASSLLQLIIDHRVRIYCNWRLKESGGVTVKDGHIMSVMLERSDGPATTTTVRAKQYISATDPYRGDMGVQAGLTYAVGREAAGANEANAGTTASALTMNGIDPYIVPGNAGSGLLPGLLATTLPAVGSASAQIMWDCYRTTVTNDPALQTSFQRPKNTPNPLWYEFLLRYMAAGVGPQSLAPFTAQYPIRGEALGLASGKLIHNWNNAGLGWNKPGGYQNYAAATYAQREAMDQELRDYTLGLYWLLRDRSDARVPLTLSQEISAYNLLVGEPYGADGLPHTAYHREGRRMSGSAYVMDQRDLIGSRISRDPIAWAYYNSDSHYCAAYAGSGTVILEGTPTNVTPSSRVPIDRGVLLNPKMLNFQDVTAPGVSRLAWCTLRIEPTLMSMGEAAGVSAAWAVKRRVRVAEIHGRDMWDALGIRVPNRDGHLFVSGNAIINPSNETSTQTLAHGAITVAYKWTSETNPLVLGEDSIAWFHSGAANSANKYLTFTPTGALIAGTKEVRIWASPRNPGDFPDVLSFKVEIKHADGTDTLTVPLLYADPMGYSLGVFKFAGDGSEYVKVLTTGADYGAATNGRIRLAGIDWLSTFG